MDLWKLKGSLVGAQVLESNPKVVLVVIDSITFHFRVGFQDMARRSSVLAQMAQQLMATADRHDLAVVLMNQVTTRLSPSGGQAKLVS